LQKPPARPLAETFATDRDVVVAVVASRSSSRARLEASILDGSVKVLCVFSKPIVNTEYSVQGAIQ
jgi:hypothetical protein